jgi:hypothetical protein
VALAGPADAKSTKPSCQKIRAAVWANRTLEQIMTEFDVDAAYVMKCTQKQGRRRAEKKPKRATAGSAKSSKRSSATGSSSQRGSQPSVRSPSSLRHIPRAVP